MGKIIIMIVKSLFDGCSCGMVALERAGIAVDEYLASEVDKYAIQISRKNYPKIKHEGNVLGVKGDHYADILIGGSPCQDLRPGRDGLRGSKSKLFYEYVRVLDELRRYNPNVLFLLENVARAKKEDIGIISGILGVQPIEINSALVSAQNRRRLYWTNIPCVMQPDDKGIMLSDIVEDIVFDMSHVPTQKCIERILRKKYSNPKFMPDKTGTMNGRGNSGQWCIDSSLTFIPVKVGRAGLVYTGNDDFTPSDKSISDLLDFLGGFEKGRRLHDGRNGSRNFRQGYRVYSDEKKSATLQSSPVGGVGGDTGLYLINQKAIGFNEGGIKSRNGKTPTLTSSSWQENNHLLDIGNYVIRKLTPIECERLQTLPDNYTEGVSNTQRYKMIGNGWTVDVISHILSFLGKISYEVHG